MTGRSLVRRLRRTRDAFRGVARVLFRRRVREADDNEMMKLVPRRRGPMSRYELFCWHRANGTLAVFFGMFPS